MRKSFIQWLENQSGLITIDLSEFEEKLKEKMESIWDLIEKRRYEVQNFKLTPQFLEQLKVATQAYPQQKMLFQAIEGKNRKLINWQVKGLFNYMDVIRKDYEKYRQLRPLITGLMHYADQLDTSEDGQVSLPYLGQQYKQFVVQTHKNMNQVKEDVSGAISRIASWNNSPVKIEARNSEDVYGVLFDAGESSTVYIGEGEYSPFFTLFKENEKYMVEDVFEGGDVDSFPTPELQADYFNLVNEIRKPGSTQRGKVLTLYTARPISDREHLEQTKLLYKNTFLSNSYSHVEGLAADLGGSEVRDIWKVRIDSRYLTQTLDGSVKYYQLTAEAPLVSLELISPGIANGQYRGIPKSADQ